jgi:hypothetical protein
LDVSRGRELWLIPDIALSFHLPLTFIAEFFLRQGGPAAAIAVAVLFTAARTF